MNFFKKKSHPASTFFSSYTKQEKIITLTLVLIGAFCDDKKLNEDELKFLNTYIDIFEVSSKEVTHYFETTTSKILFQNMLQMDEEKIDNALYMILSVLKCDGIVNERKDMLFLGVLEKVGIAPDDYKEKMEKTNALFKFIMNE